MGCFQLGQVREAMNDGESDPTWLGPADQVATGADAAQIAEALASTWRAVESALAPIIGARGVAALYRRSLHLASSAYPWLAELREGDPTTIDLGALQSAVAQQPGPLAALAGNALLQTFYQLVGSLIGPSLTERLLRSVWADSPGGAPLPDTTR
jgi:hypothetical protein